MKKAIVLFLILALTVPMLCFSAKAEEYTDPYDSRILPEAIMETPAYKETKTALHLYWWEVRDFVDYDTIEDVMENCGSYYLVKSSENWQKYLIKNGNVSQVSIWKGAEPYTTHDVINAVFPNVTIENIYYFYSALGYADYTLAIYYKTNLGDYVYFSALEYAPMLMGAKQYFDFVRAWYKAQKKQEELRGFPLGARYGLEGDWSVYDWKSPNFDPDAPLPIAREEEKPSFPWAIVGIGTVVLVAAVAVVTVLIIRKKKKKTKPEETEPIPEET